MTFRQWFTQSYSNVVARIGNSEMGMGRNLSIATVTEAEIDEARVIAAAEQAGIERDAILRGMRISLRTYYRRKALPERLKAERDRED